ncbi:hypothetical protein ElyMa_005170400 [Elysia marginata]|uniref:Uncharacterized protein n=1 Tax=Elysia marginata TaxID=1093978 RepID=A0AAV4JVK3_9GAST|nr:hypothetical protein ElyMa_005170400 [Elysia marginata]
MFLAGGSKAPLETTSTRSQGVVSRRGLKAWSQGEVSMRGQCSGWRALRVGILVCAGQTMPLSGHIKAKPQGMPVGLRGSHFANDLSALVQSVQLYYLTADHDNDDDYDDDGDDEDEQEEEEEEEEEEVSYDMF